jgi:Fe-S-cluster containining protein
MSESAFHEQFVVQVGGRISLREKTDGSCALLDGTHECQAYELRPRQCRDFPNWEYLRESEDRWKRATGYCPGIQQLPNPAQLQTAFDALKQLFLLEIELSDPCSGMKDASTGISRKASCLTSDSLRPASSLEVDLFLTQFIPTGSSCPALQGESCGAKSLRPLACRRFSPLRAAQIEKTIQDIAEDSGYPWSRGHWPRILTDRSDAWAELTGRPPLLDV